VFYRANVQCPIFEELAGLLRKTAGLVDVLSQAIVPLAEKLELAFVFGSMARGEAHAHSDVDVMLVGDLDFAEVVLALSGAQEFLRREINPIMLSGAEWDHKLAQADGFVAQIWQDSKLWLVGQARVLRNCSRSTNCSATRPKQKKSSACWPQQTVIWPTVLYRA